MLYDPFKSGGYRLFSRRHRIIPPASPGVTTAQASQCQPGTTDDAVGLDCFERIVGATRVKPASTGRTKQGRFQRGEEPPVKPDRPNANDSGQIQFCSLHNRACRSAAR